MSSAATLAAAGTPQGASSSVALPEDAWDMAGLGASDAIPKKDWQTKNGQVALLVAADHVAAKKSAEAKRVAVQRRQWQQEAEERQERARVAKKFGQASAEHHLTAKKFAWTMTDHKSFNWRTLLHGLHHGADSFQGGFISECVISPGLMRMYTDHRVMNAVVFPGVSHISLFAATGVAALPNPGLGDWHMSVKDVLFERPYLVTAGEDMIAAAEAGQGAQVGQPVTYCRCSGISKESGAIKPALDWKSLAM